MSGKQIEESMEMAHKVDDVKNFDRQVNDVKRHSAVYKQGFVSLT